MTDKITQEITEILEHKHPECFANATTFRVDKEVIINQLLSLLAKQRESLLAEVATEVIGEANLYANKIINNTDVIQLELRRLIEMVFRQRLKLTKLKGEK